MARAVTAARAAWSAARKYTLSKGAHIWHGDQDFGANGTRERALAGKLEAAGARQIDEVAAVDGVAARLLHHPCVVAERVESGEELLDNRRVEAVRKGLGGEDGLVAGDRLPRATQHHRLAALNIQMGKAERLVLPRAAGAEHLVQRLAEHHVRRGRLSSKAGPSWRRAKAATDSLHVAWEHASAPSLAPASSTDPVGIQPSAKSETTSSRKMGSPLTPQLTWPACVLADPMSASIGSPSARTAACRPVQRSSSSSSSIYQIPNTEHMAYRL
eukprot:scaffold70112_cov70-Phaeocystis_antarctica.AAC.3